MKKQFKTIILGGLLTLIITLSLLTSTNQKGLATNSETGISNKKIEISFSNNDDLDRLLDIMNIRIN